jgi:site-specific DNA recombinase
MTNALIYTRVSKDRKQSRSTAEQEAECRALCDREGWDVLDVLSDNGRSASRYAKRSRPAWEEVKARIATGAVDVLVTWEASRSNRDLAEFTELRDLMRAHSVLLNYSGRTLDLDDSSDSFRAGLDALISEDESERTRARILRNVRANAEAGRPHGRRLYGYRRVYDDKKLVGQEPDPDEAPIVREIARRFLSGESSYSISEDLNARGVPLPTGTKWSETRIRRILTNPSYTGKRTHNGKVVADATWEPILDQKTFDACVAKYADPARRSYRGGADVKHLLSGIARCGKCGSPLYAGVSRGWSVYVCKAGKGHLGRSRDHLDAYVTTVVLERLATLDVDDLTAEAPEAADARHEADELRGRLDDALAEFTAGSLSAGMLAKIEADLEPRIADAERRARAASPSPAVASLAGEGVDARWDALTVEQRREVVRLLMHMTVLPSTRPQGSKGFDPDAVRIEWRT